MFAFGSIFTIV